VFFVLLALSVIIFMYLIFDQKKKRKNQANPLVDVELFHNKEFNIGLFAVLFQFMMHTSYLLTSAVFLQNGLGVSALKSGLYFVLPGLLFTLSSIAASKLVPQYGKVILQTGVVIIIGSFALQLFLFKAGVSSLTLFLLMGIYGLGNGLVLPSLLNIALKSVPQKFAGAAAGVYSTFQQTASALGVSIIGGVFFYVVKTDHHPLNYIKAFDYSTTADIVCLILVAAMLSLLPAVKNENETPLFLD